VGRVDEMLGETAGKLNDLQQDDLNLEEALKRRLDWTPPKTTHPQIVDLDNEDDATTGIARRIGFGDLLSDYRFNEDSSTPEDRAQIRGDSHPTKRRRIEVSPFMMTMDMFVTNLLRSLSKSKLLKSQRKVINNQGYPRKSLPWTLLTRPHQSKLAKSSPKFRRRKRKP
jgi:hypothetical protein